MLELTGAISMQLEYNYTALELQIVAYLHNLLTVIL